MAQGGIQLDEAKFCCSVCLDLLKDPVTIPCGHSYCRDCIKGFWDGEVGKKMYSCPQCRQSFTPRPVLVKNTMLADLVEQLKKTGLRSAAADLSYAGADDVSCDVCTGRKLKAVKKCLQCLISYCEQHVQPHHESAAFKKHKLVDPSKNLQENICCRHDEVMKMFCRTDQQIICYLCSLEEHKGHDTVSAAAERTERQKEIGGSRQKIQQRIHNCKKVTKLLQQELETIRCSADRAVEDTEKIFSEIICLFKKRSCDMKQQIRSQQETEVGRVKDVQKKLQQEIRELKRKDAELELLSHTADHNQLLHSYPSLSCLSGCVELPSIKKHALQHFGDVPTALTQLREKLQDVLGEKWPNIIQTVIEVDAFLSHHLRTREEFLQYACKLTLDPNTAHPFMQLSEGDRKVITEECFDTLRFRLHPSSKFLCNYQVLSRESLTGRCYFEVEWDALVTIAVSYRNIQRSGDYDECTFGRNDKSWALHSVLGLSTCAFIHNKIETPIKATSSYKVGVFLDYRAGLLSFYSVTETMTLLHRVQTTFTRPLYAGLALHFSRGDSAEICEMK